MSEWNKKLQYLTALLPDSQLNFGRLKELLTGDESAKIAVFGKFNHGKSTLLNALLGYEHFSVADKRETVEVSEIEHDGTVWIDTPGLDADTSGTDDSLAIEAVLRKADILCLVHSVKAGELDKSEMEIYQKLMSFSDDYQSKFLLVLTQIDQVSPQDLDSVKKKILGQVPDLNVNCISATRYIRGIKESKVGFIDASGMLPLLNNLNDMRTSVSEFRQKEAKSLVSDINAELSKLNVKTQKSLADVQNYIYKTHADFVGDLSAANQKYANY